VDVVNPKFVMYKHFSQPHWKSRKQQILLKSAFPQPIWQKYLTNTEPWKSIFTFKLPLVVNALSQMLQA